MSAHLRLSAPSLLLCLLTAPPLPAQTPADKSSAELRQRVIDKRQELVEAKSELEALEMEETAGKPGRPLELRRLELTDADARLGKICELLGDKHKGLMTELDKLAGEAVKRRKKALDSLQEANQTALDMRAQADLARAFRAAEAARTSLFDWPLIWACVWGGVMLLVGILLLIHDRRMSLRRWWRGTHHALLAAAGLAAASPLWAAQTGTETARLEDELENLKDECKKLEEKSRAVRNRISRNRAAHLEGWAALLGPSGPNPEGKHIDRLKAMDETAMKQVRAVLTASLTARNAYREADVQLGQAVADRDGLGSVVVKGRFSNLGRTAFRAGLCVLLVLLPVWLLWRVLKRTRKRIAREARICPRCLQADTLEIKLSQKQNPLYPDPRHVECRNCQFEFREQYRRVHRLCFPTVGVIASGKTRWLGTGYLEVQNTHVPVPAKLKTAPSLGEEQFLNDVVRDIAAASSTSPSTYSSIPIPLTLHVEDVDKWGKNQGLINLFDFAGEMMSRTIDQDELRARALLMDGFVFFLDATNLQDGWLEEQRRALQSFYEDIRDIRKLAVGSRVRVPVAVCLSKVDLLTSRHTLRDSLRPWIGQLRGTRQQQVDLKLLQERSRLCEEMLPALFPGWDVRRELGERFGGSIMYFPVTSVGLQEEGLGIEDLSQREYEPFAVLEPLLWLLHMHGYCVLE